MNAFAKEFATIQDNLANANTPGYADQNQTLIADSYGGVTAGVVLSTRSDYLEQSVRAQTTLLGAAEQQSTDLAPLQSLFDLSSTSGVSGSLNSFFNSFSSLSVSPNDAAARQNVITQAQALATSFNQAAIGLHSASSDVQVEASNSISTINRIAADLTAINQHYSASQAGPPNPGLDAQATADLENLSEVANFTVLHTDGQINVYLGGQTPLVLGGKQFQVSADFSTGQTAIKDSLGNDITSQIAGGQLGAQIQENNVTLPGYLNSLNNLAQTFADTVNNGLSQGVDKNGNTPVTNLFSYNTAADAAYTLSVTPGITSDQIAAALPSAPGGNGNALALAQLATASNANGFTFTQSFGNLGQQVGSDVSNAKRNTSEQQNLVTQARAQRAAVSGVSLDTEAAKLLQFQQSYQAIGKMVTVLNSLTTAVLQMVGA